MHDYKVLNTQVQDVQSLDANAQPVITKRVTFYVDRHGPFILNYPLDRYSADRVAADIQAEVNTLKAIYAATTQQ